MRADLFDQLIALDEGELTAEEFVELHAELIRNGMAWRLPGRIGRTCASLIDAGLISPVGEVKAVYFYDGEEW
jgi:hypothetical protein